MIPGPSWSLERSACWNLHIHLYSTTVPLTYCHVGAATAKDHIEKSFRCYIQVPPATYANTSAFSCIQLHAFACKVKKGSCVGKLHRLQPAHFLMQHPLSDFTSDTSLLQKGMAVLVWASETAHRVVWSRFISSIWSLGHFVSLHCKTYSAHCCTLTSEYSRMKT